MRNDSFSTAVVCFSSFVLGGCAGSPPPPSAAASAGATAAPAGASGAAAPAPATPTSTAGVTGAAPAQPMAAVTSACANSYTTAMRVRADMSWPDTIGLVGGSGTLTYWAKLKHTPAADGGETLQTVPCGVSLPVVTTSPLLDGVRLFNEIPTASFDLPSMPQFTSHSSWRSGTLVNDTGAILLGVALDDPNAAWPERSELKPADHDGDGEPGVTAIPKNGDGFGLPPADIGFTQQVDRVYVAARLHLQLLAAEAACAGSVAGSVEPLGFDYSIVGCHVLDGGDCTADQTNLLYNNSPAFTLGAKGESTSIPMADSATCEQLLAALPVEGAD